MLDEAEEQVRSINEKTLLQKASLKKDYLKRLEDRSAKIKSEFIENYNRLLSNSLSSTILQSKEMLLQVKNDLLTDFKKDLIDKIQSLIETNYSNYLAFLINKIKENAAQIGEEPSQVEILLNSKDFNYFQDNQNKIEEYFSGTVGIKKSKKYMIGGFKLYLPKAMLSYDYTLENLVSNASNTIEQIFSSSYIDVDLESFQKEFEEFISKKKAKIEDYLKKYDEIRT